MHSRERDTLAAVNVSEPQPGPEDRDLFPEAM